MGEPQEVQLRIMAHDGVVKETNSLEENSFPSQVNQSIISREKRCCRWFRITLYAAFMLVGQSVATLLARLYYEKGGRSNWMVTLTQLAGFPILLPYYYFIVSAPKTVTTNNIHINKPAASMKAFVYVSLGLMAAFDCYLYSVGLRFLPVSTYSLICSSQLAFNAFFSYFLNSLKFTPYIINSIVLLTISSTLLVLQNESSSSIQVSKKKYVTGFICTIAASAGYGLVLSLTQLIFKKVLKRETFEVILEMIIGQSLVATIAIVVGLFASGEWKGLKNEMEEYEMGKASYLLNLIFTAAILQLSNIGCVGLIFEVSSLFSNAIGVLGVPFIPILAVIFFKDKMHGIKAISLVLSVWGFISYVYQQYQDDTKSNKENTNTHHVPDASSSLDEQETKPNSRCKFSCLTV